VNKVPTTIRGAYEKIKKDEKYLLPDKWLYEHEKQYKRQEAE